MKKPKDTEIRKGDKDINDLDPSRARKEKEENDSMDGEIETMSILVKGYKKIYPLIEFLENFLVTEYLDDDDNLNAPPIKIIYNSDDDITHARQKEAPKKASDDKDIELKIKEQQKKFIKVQLQEAVKEEGLNAENLLGFINQKKLNSYLNISNIMRLKKLDFKDVYSITDMDIYLLREHVLERFMMVTTSYFCMGTELRFLRQLKVQGFKDSLEAQFWHGRALEMAISLFPGDSPLVKHIIQSYKKHHAPSAEIIPEDYSIAHQVKVAKPLMGVHSNKEYPMIQNCDYIYDDIEDEKEAENIESSEFIKKKNENKSHCMIRITSLDMPKNDYMKYVRKVIYELNLKDEKDVIDEFPQDSSGPIKAKKGIVYSDDINSNSVLEINNILDSDDKHDDEEFTPKHKKVEDKPKASKEKKAFKYSQRKTQTVEAFTQVSLAQGPQEEQKTQTKDFGVLVIPKKSSNVRPLTSSIGCSTDITMNSKEISSIITANSEEGKGKIKRQKNQRSHLEEFQDVELIKNHSELNRNYNKNRGKRHKSNEKAKKKSKGHSYDSLKPGVKIGASTPECYLNIQDDRKTINEHSPQSKRRIRRSMDNYHNHPDFDNYLLHQTHYYNSINNFSKGAKFNKDMGMKGMIMKKNLKEAGVLDNHPQKLTRYHPQSYSDKVMRSKKKRTNSSEVVMVYHPSAKKGYPQLKSALANYSKNPNSMPESVQTSGRKKRSNSQCGMHGKRPKSTKNATGGRKYKATNQMHNISADHKLHSINHSIDHSTLITQERPSSATESFRYSKNDRKAKKHYIDQNKESIASSIEVSNIELPNQEGNFKKYKQGSNNLGYQKMAEMASSSMPKSTSKGQNKSTSNSQKLLRSTSRGGKSKKSKSKSQFKKNVKEQMHRKSKSDAKKMAEEIFKNSSNRTYKTNSKTRKANYVEQMFPDRAFIPKAMEGKESPMGIPASYAMSQLGQNWIDNINQQIEQNGKNLLDTINKSKQKSSANMQNLTKKRRKSKQGRPQSTNYMNVGFPQNSNEAFKSILNQKINNEFLHKASAQNADNSSMIDPAQLGYHNRSYNPEFHRFKGPDDEVDITDAHISLNQN